MRILSSCRGLRLLALATALSLASLCATVSAQSSAPSSVKRQQAGRAGWRYGSLALMSLLSHQVHQDGLARIDRCLPAPEQASRRREMSQAWSRLHERSLARAERILSPAFFDAVPRLEGDRDDVGWRQILALRPQLPLLAYLEARRAALRLSDQDCETQLARIAAGEDSMDRQLLRQDAGYPAVMALDLDHPERLGDPEPSAAAR